VRILHVSDVFLPRLGGIELHVRDLANRQRAAGDDVEILTLTRSSGATDLLPGTLVHRPAGTAWLATIRHAAQQRGMGVNGDFDVVHAHISTISPLAFSSLRASSPVPTVVTVHSLWRRYTWLYQFFDVMTQWGGYPIVWSAVSRAAAESVRRCSFRALDVPVLPNGFDLADWPMVHRSPDAGELRLASVMRLSGRKRPMAFLRMLRALRQRLPAQVRLSATVIGDGPKREVMQRFLSRHAMAHWVHMPGQLPRPAVATALAQATHYVAPAYLESFGLAALEARATGLPVIGMRNSGLADFVTSGREGVLVRDDNEMVDVLAALTRQPLPIEGVRDRSRLQEMTWPRILARTDDLYARAGAVVATRRDARVAS
jgi:glycosyltransferase involved in cell wall biosynthesis